MGILASKLTKKKISSQDLDKIINVVIERLLKVSQPSKIYLFGSAVSNTMTMSSDFDFAIIFSSSEQLKKEKKQIYSANLFPDMMVDLLFYEEKDFAEKSLIGGVCFEISKKGRLVYDKGTKV